MTALFLLGFAAAQAAFAFCLIKLAIYRLRLGQQHAAAILLILVALGIFDFLLASVLARAL
jgi:hypothetical protein